MSEKKDRRDFLKAAAVGVAGAAAGPMLMREAAAAGAVQINQSAKAMLPSGKLADRRAILSQLGLNPGTSPDAWLAIIACGSNASALTDMSKQQLMRKGVLKEGQMEMQKGMPTR